VPRFPYAFDRRTETRVALTKQKQKCIWPLQGDAGDGDPWGTEVTICKIVITN